MKRFFCAILAFAVLLLSACSGKTTSPEADGGTAATTSTTAVASTTTATAESTTTVSEPATTTAEPTVPTTTATTSRPIATRPPTTAKPTARTRVTMATQCACQSYRSETVTEQRISPEGFVYTLTSYDWRSDHQGARTITIKYAQITDYTGNAETLTVPWEFDGYQVIAVEFETVPETVKTLIWDCWAAISLRAEQWPSLTDVYIPEANLAYLPRGVYFRGAQTGYMPTIHVSKDAELERRIYIGYSDGDIEMTFFRDLIKRKKGQAAVIDLSTLALKEPLYGYISFE